MMRRFGWALVALAALSSAAMAQARPPSQRTGPVYIFGDGSTGSIPLMTAPPDPNAPPNSLGLMAYSPKPPGGLASAGLPAVEMTYAGQENPNVVMLRPGNSVSFCPLLSCIKGPPNGPVNSAFFDHQRASLLVSATTQDDGHSEEQTLAVMTTVATGLQKPWSAGTPFAKGDNVAVGNAVYRATIGGVSGGTNPLPASRPATLPATYSDGTITWLWINDQRISGKLGIYNEVAALAGAGTVWGGVDNLELRPGYSGTFAAAREIDLTNNKGSDCAVGSVNCYGLSIFLQGTGKSTAFLDMSSANTANYAAAYGILLGGAKAASEHDISVQSSAQIGLDFGGFGGSTHSLATIRDVSTGPIGFNQSGTHSTAGYFDGSVSGTAISLNGVYTAAIDTSSANTGYSLISKSNQRVCFNALDNCFIHDPTTQRIYYTVGGDLKFSIDPTGNVRARGTFTPNVVP